MRAAPIVVAIWLTVSLAGCLLDDEGPGADPALGTAPDPVPATFSVTVRAGGPIELAAITWPVENGTTVVVLVHGFSGVKENYWHTLPEKGYSFSSALARDGRAVVAVDLPGYGASTGAGEVDSLEDMAFALDQLAGALRAEGFEHVVAYGLSMGAATIDVGQGLYATFDAIIPTSAPHAGMQPNVITCLTAAGSDCPEPPMDDFVLERADRDVVNATLAGYEPFEDHAGTLPSLLAWFGPCARPGLDMCTHPTPYDLNAESIDVPVLSLHGEEDRLLMGSEWRDEPSYFPNSPDARSFGFPGVGHFLHNHDVHLEVAAMVDAFLQDNGL